MSLKPLFIYGKPIKSSFIFFYNFIILFKSFITPKYNLTDIFWLLNWLKCSSCKVFSVFLSISFQFICFIVSYQTISGYTIFPASTSFIASQLLFKAILLASQIYVISIDKILNIKVFFQLFLLKVFTSLKHYRLICLKPQLCKRKQSQIILSLSS